MRNEKGQFVKGNKEGFQKGHKGFIPKEKYKEIGKKVSKALTGKNLSKEHRIKLSISHIGNKTGFQKGHKASEETRQKISKRNKGKKHKEETKNKIGLFFRGKKLTEEHKKKISNSIKGKKHWNWIDGKSKNQYPREFNKELKLKIRKRDNFTCCLCEKTEEEHMRETSKALCVNHIDFNKNNCNESNLNTLCTKCNVGINRSRDFWQFFFSYLMKKYEKQISKYR
jgi:hypothetical protein